MKALSLLFQLYKDNFIKTELYENINGRISYLAYTVW